MPGERTTIRNNFIQKKVDTKMRPVYNLGTGITGRTPIQKPKMGYTCCSILQQRNRNLKLENHELKAREKKAIQRCADFKEDNVHLNNLLKSTINSNRARIELAESEKDHHNETVKDYNSLSKEYNDQAVKSNQRITELENKCELLGKNVIDLLKKRKNQNSANSHSAIEVPTVKKNGMCAKPATLEARCEQLDKNAIDLKKKRQNSANNRFANSAEPTASNFQKSEIKCEFCDKKFVLKFHFKKHFSKFHDNVEKKNTNNDIKFPTILHNSEKSKEKEEIVNLIRPKNPAATDSMPMFMLLNVPRELKDKVVETLSLKASKDQRYSEKNTKIYTQGEPEQPLEENKLEPCTSGLENPKFFLQDEDEVAWVYRKL